MEEIDTAEMIEVRVIKIDRETLNTVTLTIKLPFRIHKINDEKMLRCFERVDVGDFVKIENRIYRKLKEGFRKATEEDLAELISSQI